MATKEHWKNEPDEHDYPAARDYLTLLVSDTVAAELVRNLQSSLLVHRKAKDLLRASDLELLPESNVHVARDLAKVANGKPLSPVLLVRGDLSRSAPLTVADGYHRICASHHLDENADVPCRMVEYPRGP
jgi:hypothetical protein